MTDSKPFEIRRKTLEAIHASAVDSIITIDTEGRIESVNPATEAMFGYTASELIGENVSILMPSPHREQHDAFLNAYRDTGVANIIGIGREVSARHKDGSLIPIHLAVSEVRLEGRSVFAGFLRDLSDLKRTQQQESMLGRIVEESLSEVYVFAIDSLRFIQVNRGARKNLGYELRELQQLTPVDLKPGFTHESFHNAAGPLLNGETEKVRFSSTHQRKDGTHYDVEVFLQLSTYRAQPVFIANVLDVTDRRTAERKLREQQENMQEDLERLVEARTSELRQAQADLVRSEKFSTLGKVSGGIAHEIRNPLNAVKTSAYYLLNARSPSPEKVREHLQRIDRQVNMIDNVITVLSDLAKLPDSVLLPADMTSTLPALVRSLDLPSNIEIKLDFSDATPPVMVDENQITIAFKNLILNARDAMSQGGQLLIGSRVDGTAVVFSIADNGDGIKPENLTKVLEPLYSTKPRGMGLGLSITKAIVEKNQGELAVESEPGIGSCFSIRLKQELNDQKTQ